MSSERLAEHGEMWRVSVAIVAVFSVVALILGVLLMAARALPGDDHGNHGNLRAWFDNLSSGKGLCCSFADGSRVDDVDWDTQPNCDGNMQGGAGNDQQKVCIEQYRVRLKGEWVWVPPNALITEPNKYGPAVVWPYKDSIGAWQIRCFLPGAGA